MLKIINSAINTKVISRWSDLACSIALDAVRTVEFEENGRKEIDIKKYAKVEKVQRNCVCVRVFLLTVYFGKRYLGTDDIFLFLVSPVCSKGSDPAQLNLVKLEELFSPQGKELQHPSFCDQIQYIAPTRT